MIDSSSQTSFLANPALDPAALAERFAKSGRIQITDFLAADGADCLHATLLAEQRWQRVINGETKVFEISSAAFTDLPSEQRDVLEQAVFSAASYGFQFRYDTIRVPDAAEDRSLSGTLIDLFACFMSSPETLAMFRRITGRHEIVFADAQATRYCPGDFLTRHDDDVAGKHRSLAFVMALTPGWRPEWGGLLLFSGQDGSIIETIVPRFNALTLFAVPQPHSVSYVAPYAAADRFAVTGWLRSEGP